MSWASCASGRAKPLKPKSNAAMSCGKFPLGSKAQVRMDPDGLAWALAAWSGYVAADEVDAGPFCRLSAVAKRCYQRLLSAVLDHEPDHDDLRGFLRRLKTALPARALPL